LNGKTCGVFGYASGTLGCNNVCEFVTSGCSNPGAKICGDGNIDTPNDGLVLEDCE